MVEMLFELVEEDSEKTGWCADQTGVESARSAPRGIEQRRQGQSHGATEEERPEGRKPAHFLTPGLECAFRTRTLTRLGLAAELSLAATALQHRL